MKLTPAQWLAKEPARVEWTEGYLRRKGELPHFFQRHKSERAGIFAEKISQMSEVFFKNLKGAYAKAKSTEKNASKTFNVTLGAAAFENLKRLSGKGSMQATIRLILSDLDNTKRKIEANLEMKGKLLEKKYGIPGSQPPGTARVDTTVIQELINYFCNLVSKDLYDLCYLRYLHEREQKSSYLTNNEIETIKYRHYQMMNYINNQISHSHSQINLGENNNSERFYEKKSEKGQNYY